MPDTDEVPGRITECRDTQVALGVRRGGHNGTAGDSCDATCHNVLPSQSQPCPAEPLNGCIGTTIPGKSGIKIKAAVAGRGANSLGWKLKGGDVTMKSQFGTPLTTTDYHFCVYDETGGTPSLIMTLNAPAGGTCNGKPCWKESSTGFQYKDSLVSQQGLQQVKMKQGLVAGKTQFQVKGKGPTLPVPGLPLHQDTKVTIQIHNSDNACWTTSFTAPATKNVSTLFTDKGD